MSRLQVGFSHAPEALLRFSFDGSDAATGVACPRLAGPEMPEVWSGESADLAMVCIEVEERDGDVESAAREAYGRLLAQVRSSAHPYLIRIWNYFGDINLGDEDAERYRQFCVGRAQAVDAEFNNPPPAATAAGRAQPY